VHIQLLREGVVIQLSYKGGEYKCYFSRKGSVTPTTDEGRGVVAGAQGTPMSGF